MPILRWGFGPAGRYNRDYREVFALLCSALGAIIIRASSRGRAKVIISSLLGFFLRTHLSSTRYSSVIVLMLKIYTSRCHLCPWVTMWCLGFVPVLCVSCSRLSPPVVQNPKNQKPILDCPSSSLAVDHVLQVHCPLDPRHRPPGQCPEDPHAVGQLVVADR